MVILLSPRFHLSIGHDASPDHTLGFLTRFTASSFGIRPPRRPNQRPGKHDFAFTKTLELGADGIELDVRLTRDNELVVFHDRCLERTSNDFGPVNHRTQQEVLAFDAGSCFGPEFYGEHPPILDEVFESLPADFLINVDMKVIMKGMRLTATKP